MATRTPKAAATDETNGADPAASPEAVNIGIGSRVLYRGEFDGEAAQFYADVLAFGRSDGEGPTLRIHHPDGTVVVVTNAQRGDEHGQWFPMQ